MEHITISGVLLDDCTVKTDKNGHDSVRFVVKCDNSFSSGEKTQNLYKCITYNTNFSGLQKGDLVFLTGALILTFKEEHINDNIYTKVDLTIIVHQIASGIIIRLH